MSLADFFGLAFGAGALAPLASGGLTLTLITGDATYVACQFVGPPFTPYRDQASLVLPEPGALAILGLGAVALLGGGPPEAVEHDLALPAQDRHTGLVRRPRDTCAPSRREGRIMIDVPTQGRGDDERARGRISS